MSACARDFFSASNIGFKQEESALGLGLVCSIQDTVFIPKNQNLSLLAHSLSTFSLEASLSREEMCYFGVFSIIFWFCCSELPRGGLEKVLIPLFLRDPFFVAHSHPVWAQPDIPYGKTSEKFLPLGWA